MSGTSLDSIDAALIEFSDHSIKLVDHVEHAIPETLREELISLCQPSNNEIDRMGSADVALGHEFARAVNALLAKSGKLSSDITAIGSHGQTIRHRPNFDTCFTLQIGDANVISHLTGIDTVADFRRKDMAAGGQGAPLAPAFHQAVFRSNSHNRAIVNIGGIANITYLASDQTTLGFDTGPGNILMDSWIQLRKNQKYDRDGLWAASGEFNPPLLAKLLEHPYLKLTTPKSTGREDFCLNWLQELVGNSDINDQDIQATLLEFTAKTLCDEISKLLPAVDEVYICGGGAYNSQLMQRINTLLHPKLVTTTKQLGIPAEWVEAAAFAWLAKQTIERKPGNLTSVTGATKDVVLGAIYPA
jgi:anhydro-N-acetylmuramic acid kinase